MNRVDFLARQEVNPVHVRYSVRMATIGDLYQKADQPAPGRAWLTLFTVVIPLAGLSLEPAIRPLERGRGVESFDPFFPTLVHRPLCALLCLVALITLWNLAPSSEVSERKLRRLDVLATLLGFGIAVAAYYSVFLAVMTPFFLFLIVMFGLGILGFSPYFFLVGAWRLLGRIRFVSTAMGRDPGHGRSRIALAFFAGLMLMSGLDLRSRYWMEMLHRGTSHDPDTVTAELPAIRRWFGEDELLRYCYLPHPDYGSLMGKKNAMFQGFRGNQQTEEFRRLYYRVTGVPFNEVPPPHIGEFDPGGQWQDAWVVDGAIDREVGGETVEGRIHSLAMIHSELEGVVDARTASARLRWRFEFKNSSDRAREARMILGLPPDATASELVLWVNGQPCRAAFGGRQQTREAYQSVAVVQRRDPALLGTAGPDRVLLQVFPVPAQGRATVLVEVTAPVFLEKGAALLRLPHLVQRNFEIGHLAHELDLRVEGSATLQARFPAGPTEAVVVPGSAPGSLKYRLSDGVLFDVTSGTIAIPGMATPSQPVLGAAVEGEAQRHEQELADAVPGSAPEQLRVVIDASTSVGRAGIDWGQLLGGLPVDPRVEVFVASDQILRWSGRLKDPALAGWLSAISFRGGIDPVAALGEALRASAGDGRAPVLWLHGVQPHADELLDASMFDDGLPGAWIPDPPPIVAIALDPGQNVVMQAWGYEAPILIAPRLGSLAADLERAIVGCGRVAGKPDSVTEVTPPATPEGETAGVSRTRPPLPDAPVRLANPFSDRVRIYRKVTATPADAAGSADVRTLGALAVVREWLRTDRTDEAVALAVAERLVTPVTGAVVLERQEDYEEHGLEAPGSGGAVPEPEVVLLMLAGYALLRRRRAR